MKYKTAQDMAVGLRDLADFIEKHGHEIPSEWGWSDPDIRFSIWYSTKGQMRKAAKALAKLGMVRKDYSSSTATLRVNFGPHVIISCNSSREQICTKRVVEVKKVPMHKYIEIPNEYVDEEVVEWDCDPIIANA